MTAIVIPACDIRDNNRADLDGLLSDIQPFVESIDEVIVCFDSCSWEFVNHFREKFPFIHAIWNQGKAFKFTKNSNQGLRYAFEKGYDVWLINQDCRIPNMKGLIMSGNEGLCSAVAQENPEASKEVLVYTDIERCAFFCVRISHKLMEKIGFLDEAFQITCSDDDAALRTHLAGFPVQRVNVCISHKGSFIDSTNPNWESSSGSYNSADLALSVCQYRNKWDCGEVEHDKIIQTARGKFPKWEDRFYCK